MFFRGRWIMCASVLVAWLASCALVAGIVPVRGWALGVGGGSVWIEHPVAGDDSAWQVFLRGEISYPRLWVAHEKAANWENWSMPLWPIGLVLIFIAGKAPRPVRANRPRYGGNMP